MPGIESELLGMARRAMYVCRLYDPAKHAHRGVEARNCVDCGRAVAVTTSVLRDRMQTARDAGAVLDVVCDDCGVKEAGDGPEIVVMPSAEEIAAANAPRMDD